MGDRVLPSPRRQRRAYRYIEAAQEEWLYPERHVEFNWPASGDEHLLMPDPRSLHRGAEIVTAARRPDSALRASPDRPRPASPRVGASRRATIGSFRCGARWNSHVALRPSEAVVSVTPAKAACVGKSKVVNSVGVATRCFVSAQLDSSWAIVVLTNAAVLSGVERIVRPLRVTVVSNPSPRGETVVRGFP